MIHCFKICTGIILTLIFVACSTKPSQNPQECSNMIWDIPNCDDCDGYFGLYGVDQFSTGKNWNRADGRIHNGANFHKDIDGGSWFVNNLEFEKKINGYGHSGFSGINKPDFDSLWGKNVQIKLSGNDELNIGSISGQVYLPHKLDVDFKVNGVKPTLIDTKKPIKLKKSDEVNILWTNDDRYDGNVLISLSFNRTPNYSPKSHADFKDYNLGKTWTPNGEMQRIIRAKCVEDDGEFKIKSDWIEDFESGNVIWVYVSRRTSNIITKGKNSFVIFSDYEVSRSFKIE